ncbi:IS110 family transposase [Listeria goaensis]|uniref:IS110 family transposase n=1 Tax=Listeria goaensis TaxID=1649188 RepID=UPI000B58C6F5|nr:IS110 family transposase [Listeria goaensis]
MHEKQTYAYIGIDIHKDTHTAVILNCWEEVLGTMTFLNQPSSYASLCQYVNDVSGDFIPLYGLEDVTHYGRHLTAYLNEQGHEVREVNAALSYMERMSYPSTHKSDEWDAQCIASVLIRRLKHLKPVRSQELYWTAQVLVQRREALKKAHMRLTAQFHNQIKDAYPSYKSFFHDVTIVTALAFFERFPSPIHLGKVTVEELASFLRKASRNACSTKKAETIYTLAMKEKSFFLVHQPIRDSVIQSLVRDLFFKKEELDRIEQEMARFLPLFGQQLQTFPGIHTVTAMGLLAHIGDIKRFKNADKLAKYAGIAPINHSSAGKGKDRQSKQGNRDLYHLFYFLAIQQIQVSRTGEARNALFFAYFKKKIAEGKTKVQALICVMRRLVTILYQMMKHQQAYNPPPLPETSS